MWSPSSRTALAEAEVSYKDDHVSHSVFVRFPINNVGPKLAKLLESQSDWSGRSETDKQISLAVWTTTPWTLPSNMVGLVALKARYNLIICLLS